MGRRCVQEVAREIGGLPELNVLGSVVVASHQDPSGGDLFCWQKRVSPLARWSNGTVKLFSRADGLSHEDVRAIIDDGAGGLWIGSNGGGLNHFQNGKFTAIRHDQGLADYSVWACIAMARMPFGSGLWRRTKFVARRKDHHIHDHGWAAVGRHFFDCRRSAWVSLDGLTGGVFRVPKKSNC